LTRFNSVDIQWVKLMVFQQNILSDSRWKNVSEYCWQMIIDLDKCVKRFLAALYYTYILV